MSKMFLNFKKFLLNDYLKLPFFKNTQVPVFDKVCAGFLLTIFTLVVLGEAVALVALLFSKPVVFMGIVFGVFTMVAIFYTALKYG